MHSAGYPIGTTMTLLLPGLWFLFVALVTAWLVRRLEELPGSAVGVGLGICFLVFSLVLASPRIDSVPPFGRDSTAAVANAPEDFLAAADDPLYDLLAIRILLDAEPTVA